MGRHKLPSVLRTAYNAVQGSVPASQRAAGVALLQQQQQQLPHPLGQQTRGKAQAAATATRQASPTLSVPVVDIKTDLYGAVSAVSADDGVQEGVFQVSVWAE